MAVSGATSWGPHLDSGRGRLLAVNGTKRASRWPNAPTLNEFGYPVSDTPFGIGGPKDMDPVIVQRLQDALQKKLGDRSAGEDAAVHFPTLMPASLMTAAHFALSFCSRSANACTEFPTTVTPCAW